MILCPISRLQLLNFLPKGGEGAEIGVARGEFSKAILDTVKPRKLHLIDPWEHQTREDYDTDGNNVEDAEQESRYRGVIAQFAEAIDDDRVILHRRYSQDAATFFHDGQLDWVYIDGLHSYQGVRSDLALYQSKVKVEGLIMGHDYTNHERAQAMKFGVVDAVNEFVGSQGLSFVALTQEAFPTYVLARDADAPAARHLIAHLLYHVPGVVELRDFPAICTFQHKILEIGGQVRILPSF
ncbi:MAG TPA: class I SAM-dependent methyltransferase [Stellaceae bacterium]|nr:class I SAM-dependent methyltransferase [Stellaceae bacterium]